VSDKARVLIVLAVAVAAPIAPAAADNSVAALARAVADVAVEPETAARWPMHGLLGTARVDGALGITTDEARSEVERWWAEQIPLFDCPDQAWKRCWYYRWFLVRVNYAEEDGTPGFYEGKRGHFQRHITYSAPHIMDETRWLRDSKYAYGQAEILGRRREPSGRRFGGYTHWIPATLWDTYCVHPDREALERLLPAWAEDTRTAFAGGLDAGRPDFDYLLEPPNHWRTGMEWQPAWFYFAGYDTGQEARLWRPDYTAYYCANARAVASMYRVLGEQALAKQYDALGARIKDALLNHMWDETTQYFYSLRVGDGAKAWVKEVVGVYPFAFGIPEARYTGAFRSLLSPIEFWGPWPVTTCTMLCPMFTPRVHLCNWDGPVWPHAESLVANALGQAIRSYRTPLVTRRDLFAFLDSYTRLHFEDKGAWRQPNLHEEGDADTGEMQGCPDYFHSTYCDLLVSLVAGLVPRPDDDIELSPVAEVPWDHFRIDRLPYHGHLLSIVWDQRADRQRYDGAPKGYSLYVDGRLVGTRPRLEAVTYRGAAR
jgi:hypothetical protein